jgi:hypothetical protein
MCELIHTVADLLLFPLVFFSSFEAQPLVGLPPFFCVLCVCKEGEGGSGRMESSGGSDVCVAGLDGQGGERDLLPLLLPGRGPAQTTQ